ncbi:hypothetical protein ACHAWC_005230, partial [Mediolabrus comicus]
MKKMIQIATGSFVAHTTIPALNAQVSDQSVAFHLDDHLPGISLQTHPEGFSVPHLKNE